MDKGSSDVTVLVNVQRIVVCVLRKNCCVHRSVIQATLTVISSQSFRTNICNPRHTRTFNILTEIFPPNYNLSRSFTNDLDTSLKQTSYL